MPPPEDPPAWWAWQVRLTPHLRKRMIDRGFNEVEVRSMLESPQRIVEDHEPGRFAVDAVHRGRRWRLIVEPDPSAEALVVITAFRPG